MKKQKRNLLIGAFAASLLLCGVVSADTTPWTSEEFAPAMCQPANAAYHMECRGGYCDDVRMTCDAPSKAKTSSTWTAYKSEEEGYNFCPSGSVVTGVSCSGSNCDNLSLQCTYLNGASMYNCNWQGYFSEELPVNYGTCPGIQYMTGIFCSGSNCDNKWLYCCDI